MNLSEEDDQRELRADLGRIWSMNPILILKDKLLFPLWLLLQINTKIPPLIPLGRFSIDNLPQDPVDLFRFDIPWIRRLSVLLRLPEFLHTSTRKTCPRIEAFCILCKWLSFPQRWRDLCFLFRRSVGSMSEIYSLTLELLYLNWKHLILQIDLVKMDAQGLLNVFAAAVINRGGILDAVIGFIDGTLRPSARPIIGQRAIYSGI